MLMDAAWVVFSLSFVAAIRPILSLLDFVAIIPPPYTLPWIIYLIFPAVWVTIFSLFSIYDSQKFTQFSDEIPRLIMGSLVSSMCLAGILFLTFRDVSRFMFILFTLFCLTGLAGWRAIARTLMNWPSLNPTHPKKYLILGEISKITGIGELITGQTGFECLLFPTSCPTGSSQEDQEISLVEQVLEYSFKEGISDVVLTSSFEKNLSVNELVDKLHRYAFKLWVIPDYFQLAVHRASLNSLAGLLMLELRAPALSERQRLVKRAFDLVISCVILLPILFIMFIIFLAIKIESPGPVIFRQKRVRENGKLFEMLKFRTMVTNAEELRFLVEQRDEHGVLLHKQMDDPRVTKIGKFLRRTSLDELPQIFNVIKGEMSLVGPRPELPYLVSYYQNWQRQRFTVPQGITGWWQINGRSDRPMHLHTEDDIYYVQNYSIWMDIYILYKTIGVVISGKGAF
jgi:exopolysaccharide biosynthesis polyprenyl glycosylphosphotransferase